MESLSLENILVNFNEHDARKQEISNQIKIKLARAFNNKEVRSNPIGNLMAL